jgi:phosphopantetheine--protein transferase-like protein
MHEVFGCGIDIENISRFEKHLLSENEVSDVFKRVFTPKEIELNLQNPREFFPLGFSTKESFFKAFGLSWTNSALQWTDFEILFKNPKDFNDFELVLSNHAQELISQNSIKEQDVFLKIHENFVISQVILLT